MINKTARQDIEHLQAQGIDLTPGEIVTLHTLATRLARNRYAAEMIAAPRVADAGGGVILYEPTLAAERWLKEYALEWWDDEQHLQDALIWSCAHAYDLEIIRAASQKKGRARRIIRKWLAQLKTTRDQLLVALVYVMQGEVLELPKEVVKIISHNTPQLPEEGADSINTDIVAPITTMISDAIAMGVNLSLDNLQLMPERILADILIRRTRYTVATSGGQMKAEKISNKAFIEYERFLRHLESRGRGAEDGKKN